MTEHENRRKIYRLRLPEAATLRATICNHSYEVVEVSERSICLKSRYVKNINGQCAGVLYWSDGSESNFFGEAGHLIHLGRLILNVSGISTKDIVNETRRLIVRFPLLEY